MKVLQIQIQVAMKKKEFKTPNFCRGDDVNSIHFLFLPKT